MSITYDAKLDHWLENTDDETIKDIVQSIQEIRTFDFPWKYNKLRDKILNELRISRINQAATEVNQAAAEATLREMRASARPARDLLEQLWLYLESQEMALPIEITTKYLKLNEADPYVKPASNAAASPDRLEEPAKADAKQNRSDIPRRTTEVRTTAVEETPSIRARTAGYITPIKDITLQFSSERFSGNHTEAKDEERDLPDLPDLPELHSSSPIALTEEEVDALNKRRRPGEAEYVIKRRKIVQDISAPRSHSSNHIVPDVNIKAEGEEKTRSASVKPEE